MCGWCEFLHVSGYSCYVNLLLPKTNNYYDTFIAEVELRSSNQLISIVDGAIGGVLVVVTVLVLIIIIVISVKYKTRHEIKPDAMGE